MYDGWISRSHAQLSSDQIRKKNKLFRKPPSFPIQLTPSLIQKVPCVSCSPTNPVVENFALSHCIATNKQTKKRPMPKKKKRKDVLSYSYIRKSNRYGKAFISNSNSNSNIVPEYFNIKKKRTACPPLNPSKLQRAKKKNQTPAL